MHVFPEQQDVMEQDNGTTIPSGVGGDWDTHSPQQHHHQQQQQQLQMGGYSVGLESPLKGKVAKNHSLLPVTIRQLHLATQNHPEDVVFHIDGQDLNEVTVVGQILSRKDGQTTLTFHLDDGTGGIYAKVWIGENDEETQQRHQHLREGMYVRAIGQLRAFNSQRSLVAFRIRAITDFNEITFHFLDVIYTHALNVGSLKIPTVPSLNPQFQYSNNTNSFYRAPPLDNDMTPLQRAILELTRMAPASGIKIDDICQRLIVQGYRSEDIRHDVNKLFQEGCLYTTISEEHFKSN